MEGGTWVDLGGGLADGLRAGGDAVRMYSHVHTVHLEQPIAQDTPAAVTLPVKVHEHHYAEPLSAASVAAHVWMECGTADVVTLCHSLVSEDDWAARLRVAKELLRPGGYLAVCDLAPPSSVGVLGRVRSAFWSAARRRGAAPHHAAVVSKLRELAVEVHSEDVPARRVASSDPLQAAHFIYVGRTGAH